MKRLLFSLLAVVVLVGAGCPGPNGGNPPPAGDSNQDNEEQPEAIGEVQVYLIALSDGTTLGPVGCGDDKVAVTRVLATPTTDPLRAALDELFSIQTRDYGQSGLYHTLWSSRLKVDKITETTTNVKIELSGPLLLGGVCDNPRVEAQIVETAKLYSGGKTVEVFLEGKSLSDALSLKGD